MEKYSLVIILRFITRGQSTRLDNWTLSPLDPFLSIFDNQLPVFGLGLQSRKFERSSLLPVSPTFTEIEYSFSRE